MIEIATTFVLTLFLAVPVNASETGWLAYSRLTDGYWQIWVVDAGGGSSRQITRDPSDKRHPAWSSNGEFLVYNDSGGHLFKRDLSNGDVIELRTIPAASDSDLSNNNRLVHQCVRHVPDYLLEIWSSELDGTERRVLTDLPLRHLGPSWSPQGDRVAVAEFNPTDEKFSIALIEDDGAGRTRYVVGNERLSSPAWSPSGSAIAFIREIKGNHDLWLLDIPSGEERQLTFHPDLDTQPSFSADGNSIVFVSRRSGSLQLWTLRLDEPASPTLIAAAGEGCRDPSWSPMLVKGGPERLSLVDVKLSGSSFDPSSGETVIVSFEIAEPASVELVALQEDGSEVSRIGLGDLPPGGHQLSWDGTDLGGEGVAPGVFLIAVEATNEGATSIWNPSRTEGGEVIRVTDLKLEESSQSVSFSVPVLSRVRVRFGLDKGPLIATPVDFAPLAPGSHHVAFDGGLPVGWGAFWSHPDRHVWVTAFALPPNAVLVEPGLPGGSTDRRLLPIVRPTDEVLPHAYHEVATCKDPVINAYFRGSSLKSQSGLPIVSEAVDLVIDVEDLPMRAHFESSRFEVIIYLDDYFLMEDEDSVLPFSYRFDVSRFPEGEHAFLVNVTGFSNHAGAIFVPFIIDRSAK